MKKLKDLTSKDINKIYSIIVDRDASAGKIEWTPKKDFVVAIFKVEESKVDDRFDTVEYGISINNELQVRHIWMWKAKGRISVENQPLYNHHLITKYLLDEGFDVYNEISLSESSMKLYAEKGHKVKVTEQSIKNGYDHDVLKAKKFLKVGETYTVESMIVHNWSSSVVLQEIPEEQFNSVNFIDVITI